MALGETAREAVAEALRGTDRRRWLGALRSLAAQPDDVLHSEIPWEKMLGQPMVWVPPGPFLMGSDKAEDLQALSSELPQHEVMLPGYWIGRHLVTVARFTAFVEGSGYEAWGRYGCYRYGWRGPHDHPVVNVDWYDARAYCRWLGEKTGLPVKLPSEAEWEKAARGTDGRIYPWGDDWDPKRCNAQEMGIGGTSSVGQFSPQGDSPYGCADMAGNVWEWTRSLYKDYPYRPDDGREDSEVSGRQVLRGGAFHNCQRLVRCAFRFRLWGHDWFNEGSFRIVVALG